MTLEEGIAKALMKNNDLAGKLVKYGNEPAIFYQRAPGDLADGWKGKPQYPRIDFTVDRQANPERQSEGSLVVDIWCLDSGISPEEIEPLVRETLWMLFFTPADGVPVSVSWGKSDTFEVPARENTASVIGITMQFDIYAYPCQQTSTPDPVQAMNHFVRKFCPGGLFLGEDNMPDMVRPDDTRPIFYFRLRTLEPERAIYAVTWMQSRLSGHIICPSATGRVRWLKTLVDQLAVCGEVEMLDGSPLALMNIHANSEANCLTSGQLNLHMRYGILRQHQRGHDFNCIKTKGGE